MKDYDVCQLGTAKVGASSNLPIAQCIDAVSDTEEDAESYGEIPMMCALGVTALPAPPDAAGSAEGVLLRSCGGYDAVLIGGRDPRYSKIAGQLKGGESALHTTGKDFGAAFLAKDGAAVIMVKKKPGSSAKDIAIVASQDTEQVTIAAFGHVFELSEANGIAMCAKGGKASISIKDDTIWLKADAVLFGGNPTLPILLGTGPTGAGSNSMKGSP